MKKMEAAAMAAYLKDVQNNADLTSQVDCNTTSTNPYNFCKTYASYSTRFKKMVDITD